MTFLWLICWLLSDTPAVEFSPEVNGWAILLIVAIALDIGGGSRLT